MQYAYIIAWAGTNFSAHVPDLPGCISTAATLEDMHLNIQEAIEFHLDGMRMIGEPIPEPATHVGYAKVA